MHQNRFFSWGSVPDPAGGAYSAPPDPSAVFKGPTSKEKEGEGEDRREGEGRGGRERPYTPLSQIPGYATGTSSQQPLS